MSRTKQILMAGGTFAVALGIGFIVQNGDALAARLGNPAPPAPSVHDVDAPDDLGSVAPMAVDDMAHLQEAGFVPSRLDGPEIGLPADGDLIDAITVPARETAPGRADMPMRLAAVEADVNTADPVPQDSLVGESCMIEMIGAAVEMAMVDLVLHAPCQPDTNVIIHHQGMMFSLVTDHEGKAEFASPALAETAVFIAAFANGEGAVATVTVPDITSYDRAVLQWSGTTGLQLHAREFGAGYGEEGHVWAAAMGNTTQTMSGSAGFMARLGETGSETAFVVEVYSFPLDNGALSGDVALSVEAEITAENCGREISAQSIQINPDRDAQALDLTMMMPDCDAVGDFIVLTNMFQDLTLALR